MSSLWQNEQRDNPSLAAVVGMAVASLVFAIVTAATIIDVGAMPDGAAFDDLRDDRIAGLFVAFGGWLMLMCLLVWVGFGRAPDPRHYTRPLPPLGFMTLAAVGVSGVAFEDDDTFTGVTIAAGAWCWIWGVVLLLAEEDSERELPERRGVTTFERPVDTVAGTPPTRAAAPSESDGSEALRPTRPPGRHRRPKRA